ncbi:hypothetical protein [Streptomyces sp. UH6]|uniref:hypothetical protein n=1 Tax=Streptomyces sp. UH6 TaxID=2748379 RepID=UPI0015D4C304|nr:hypothetical protein [Streptomyces sp. UH6]NYV73895.1 hypothetical protein [Streptomyces sp. UH6]
MPYIGEMLQMADADSPGPPLRRIADGEDTQVSATEYAQQAAEARGLVQQLRAEQRSSYLTAVRRGFTDGDECTWQQLLDLSPEPSVPSLEGYLEAATTDTYLAVDETALDLEAR